MKKIIFILSAASLLLVSCNRAKELLPATEDNTQEITANSENQAIDSAPPADTAAEAKPDQQQENIAADKEVIPGEDAAKSEDSTTRTEEVQDADQAPQTQPEQPAEAESTHRTIQIAPDTGKEFISEGLVPADKHIKLKLKKDKSYGEWLDNDKWLEDNGFAKPGYPYSDDLYKYECDGPSENPKYECHSITVTQKDGTAITYDFQSIINHIITSTNVEYRVTANVGHAQIVNNTLYVQIDGSYNKEVDGTFIMALDLDGKVLWRSRKRVSNSSNFLIIKDTIITGFGSSFDPDFIYTLDARTGKILDTISVKKAVNNFIVQDDLIHVSTYNRVYTFAMQ